MAHELAHVKNRDTLTMTITATIAGAISMLANFRLFFGDNRHHPLGIFGAILAMILTPLPAALLPMAISRTRAHTADRAGAETLGQPPWPPPPHDQLNLVTPPWTERMTTTLSNPV